MLHLVRNISKGINKTYYQVHSILITKANEMHYFSDLFDKILYMCRAGPLSIIRSLNTVYTSIGICHTSYVDCLLARSILTTIVDSQRTGMTNTYCCVYSIETPDDGQRTCPKHVQYFIK